jgi:hypothetical protein
MQFGHRRASKSADMAEAPELRKERLGLALWPLELLCSSATSAKAEACTDAERHLFALARLEPR